MADVIPLAIVPIRLDQVNAVLIHWGTSETGTVSAHWRTIVHQCPVPLIRQHV
jgi:hypothetical protein